MPQMANPKNRMAIAILAAILIVMLNFAYASENDILELKKLIASFDDPKITSQDLAFYLLTHNFDAKPMGDYVELNLNGANYRLIPNGDKPGLCDILPANSPP